MILVTGAAGLLGANLLLEWSDRHRRLWGAYGRRAVALADVPMSSLDVTNEGAVRDLMDRVRPTHVVHAAAATDVDWCEKNPSEALRINADGAANVARHAARLGARFVLISTDALFRGDRGASSESEPCEPVNAYARSKQAAEESVAASSPEALILRTNIYGWNALPKRSLAEWMLDRLERGSDFPAFEDVVFSPILVNDLSELIWALLDRGAEGIWNVAGGEAVSKWEFARRVARRFGHPENLAHRARLDDVPLEAPRPRRIDLDVRKIERFLGRPMPTVDAGLTRFRTLRDSGFVSRLKAMSVQ